MMTAEVAIAVVIGANLGSTGTALLASIPLSHEARRAAVANLLFNVGGLLLWIPFIPLLADAVMDATASPAMAVALAHVLFNLSTALVFLALLKPFASGMDRLLPPKQAAVA
jgi:phosphate:Na+ symporter